MKPRSQNISTSYDSVTTKELETKINLNNDNKENIEPSLKQEASVE